MKQYKIQNRSQKIHSCVPLRSTCPGDVIFRDNDLDYPPYTHSVFFQKKLKRKNYSYLYSYAQNREEFEKMEKRCNHIV